MALAAFLYLGSGVGLAVWTAVAKGIVHRQESEAGLTLRDIPWLAGAILAGGVAVPILLLFNLKSTPASTASLLLNLEGIATTLIAWVVFREAIGKKVWWAIAFVSAASILLSWNTSGEWGLSLGAYGIIGACVLWGADNNLTRQISAKNPLTIVIYKGIGAGLTSLVIAISLGVSFPRWTTIALAMIFGCLSYGLSIILFIRALRSLGAARTSAFFGTAPFFGAAFSLVIFPEAPSLFFILAVLGMAAGSILLLSENHAHEHLHGLMTHEHRHNHQDGHHQHTHESPTEIEISHSHWHTHPEMVHSHPHSPDIHHRHAH